MKIDENLLAQGRQRYEETNTEANRPVRDPVITPFGMAMQIGGYVEVPRQGGCSELRECPFCKNKYSTKYLKDNTVYWGCPHCKNITTE